MFEIGTATSVTDLMAKLATFLKKGHSLEPVYAGTGTGALTALAGTTSSVLETFTVTFTDATHFGVVGSVSGSLGTGTTGTPFTSTPVNLTIAVGGVAFISGDTITFVMTAPWTENRFSSGDEGIYTAPGNGGTEEIVVGWKRFTDTTGDYDNLRLCGFTGFDSGLTFLNQPGATEAGQPVLPLLKSGSIPYWFVASGRRVVIVAKVSTVYESAYLGLIEPYANPTQYPYPLLIGGCMAWQTEPGSTSSTWRWSYQGAEHRAFPMAGQNIDTDIYSQFRLRTPNGVWRGFDARKRSATPGAYLWPYSNDMLDLRANLDGGYSLFPVIASEDLGVPGGDQVPTSPNVYGELEGIAAVTGFSQAAENTITVGRTKWLVVQDVYRNSTNDYFAVRLA